MALMSLLKKTLHSITRARLLVLMLLCAGLALVLVVVTVIGFTWLAAHVITFEQGWLDTLMNWMVGVVLGAGGWFMLPVLVILIAGAFQDVTIHRVESVEYPDEVRQGEPRFWPDVVHDIRFTLKALVLNISILPFYFIGIGFLLTILLNSYLLGREFFESAAGYHLGKAEAQQLGRRNRKMVYGSGLLITLVSLVPVLNLFAPIIAIVWMVHLYHNLPERAKTSLPSSGL
ncbi:MAG: EI24 domain-containing protein [Desulfobulbaceae bacterium]|nr:EI24 domain-containing protein [Desulfobulbaceae bacterium]